MANLNDNIRYIKGVGPSRVDLLNKLQIYTLADLLSYYPRAYEDRSKYKKISELLDEETVAINARINSSIKESRIRKNMVIYKATAEDETGVVFLTWFNTSYIKKQIKIGEEYTFYGKVKGGLGRFEMNSPIFEESNRGKNTGKIIPIYPLTYGITQNIFRKILEIGLNEYRGNFVETLTEKIRKDNNLVDINYAMENIHFPKTLEDFEKARYRIAFEELLIMQLGLFSFKNNSQDKKLGIAFDKDEKISELTNLLPYTLTNAQKKVWNEIDQDMRNSKSMNRLVQGDVGSGKTVVAMMAMYKAVKNGYQAVLMAPTSILSKQHFENIKKILEKFNITVELLISDITKKKKENILERLKSGEIDVIIGTHAVLEENVEFNNIGLVITDEQHRFGVRQRKILSQKGNMPDTLVMTATPIPRTLAIILYGDLDISIIDELPPGRQKIDTYPVERNMENRVNAFVNKEIDSGRQVYIVCPLVEESEEIEGVKSVKEQLEYYRKVFDGHVVEMLHGKMKPKEKDETMKSFKDKKIDVLIATTVIEVGVDVPNATIMIVENAERFGLAQLHQLRGRVGRGNFKSYCILKYDSKSKIVKERMNIMKESSDGFVISEKDLELRGPGDFFGTKQHGIPEFKVANLFTDIPILKKAQVLAKNILEEDPYLKSQSNSMIRAKIQELFSGKINL